MTDMIRVAIVGTGNIADGAHAPAVKRVKDVKLAGVLSRHQDSGKAFLLKHGSEDGEVFTNIKDLASSQNIDLVIITSPDGLHFLQAKACLESGKHVLLEKPMALSQEEATELDRLADSRGLTLAIGFHLRSHVGHRLLHDRLKELGNVKHIRAIWAYYQNDNSNWRAKNELTKWWSLSAVGSHCLDLTRWFAGDTNDWKQLKSVISQELWHGPHDETAVLAGQFSNGITAEVVSSVQFGHYNRLEIFGDKGIALCSDTFGRLGAGNIIINGEALDFTPADPFAEQLKDVINSIKDKTTPRVSSQAGVRSVLDLLQASS